MKLELVERRAMVKMFRKKYAYAVKRAKTEILNEFMEATGFNRNYASQLLRGAYDHKKRVQKPARKPYYGIDVVLALEKIWHILDRICGKRTVKILPEIIAKLEQFGEIELKPETKQKLVQISASSIDRLLRPAKRRLGRKGTSTTKQPRYLIDKIRIKTFGEWKGTPPGFAQIDLVAHNGGNVYGGFVHSLNATDVCLGWTNCTVVRDKTKLQMLKSLTTMKRQLPYLLRGMHSDNGAEFINETVVAFAVKHGIDFTRGRPYKKNDNPHVEQKNYSVLRRNTGYLRYDKPEHVAILKEMYGHLNLYVNYFQPIMILKEKHRQGSKSIRKYDEPRTPFQRLMSHAEISDEVKASVLAIYEKLNPAELKRNIDDCQSRLIQTASPATRKQATPKNIRNKKVLKHTLPNGRRDVDPFLEKERMKINRQALKTLDDDRK